ncbi:MAG: hypothetical protein ABL930_09495 [Pseudobdellovibrio sp.]
MIAVLAMTLVNPFGWRSISYTWQTALISKARNFDEWLPTHYFDYAFQSAYFYIFAMSILGIILFRKKASLSLFSDPFFLLWLSGFVAVRNTFFIFLVLPIFTFNELYDFKTMASKNNAKSKVFNALIILLLAASIVLLSPFYKNKSSFVLPQDLQPVFDLNTHAPKISEYLKTNNGRVFNSWSYGSSLALTQPNFYFIDTRNIIFSDEIVKEYKDFVRFPELNEGIPDRYEVSYVMVNKQDLALLTWLQQSARFELVLDEDPAYLYKYLK